MWIGVIVYVLLAVVKKRERLTLSLSQMLTILSVRACEKLPVNQVFSLSDDDFQQHQNHKQLELFDL